jgi:aminoglycoside phosphotransferase (APT) family kinase protein
VTTTATLAGDLERLLDADARQRVDVEGLRRVSSGASRETWGFEAVAVASGARRRLVLQRTLPGAPLALGAGAQAQLLRAAAEQDVPVPAVVASGAADLVTAHVDGEALPRRILADERFASARARLAGDCGRALARIHRIPVGAVAGLPGGDQLAAYRGTYGELGQLSPTFELTFRWLDRHRSAPARRCVVHGDFRTGNLLVAETGLAAVLDWELAHLGDPLEDLGWLCAKAWRFGAPAPVGGFGTYDDLFDAYEQESGSRVDRAAIRWWEVFATLRWGVLCIAQTMRHLTGAIRSVELAAVGRRVCEVEHDLLALLRQMPS